MWPFCILQQLFWLTSVRVYYKYMVSFNSSIFRSIIISKTGARFLFLMEIQRMSSLWHFYSQRRQSGLKLLQPNHRYCFYSTHSFSKLLLYSSSMNLGLWGVTLVRVHFRNFHLYNLNFPLRWSELRGDMISQWKDVSGCNCVRWAKNPEDPSTWVLFTFDVMPLPGIQYWYPTVPFYWNISLYITRKI